MKPSKLPAQPLRQIYASLLDDFPSEARLVKARVGLHWTMVTLEIDGQKSAGLAASVTSDKPHGEADDVSAAGGLDQLEAAELVQLVHSNSLTERALALAALNAWLSLTLDSVGEQDALELLRSKGKNKRIGLVGHFPFIPRLKPVARELLVFEKEPSHGEYPAAAVGDLLPSCQVVALTSMTLLNGTFDELISNTQQAEYVMLLGPSTPLSPKLFEFGINCLAGTLVEEIQPVATAVSQGANYRQLHQIGTKLITLEAGQDSRPLK